MCIPFAWTHDAVREITYESEDWIGSIEPGWEWSYADTFLLLTFGGIPWQVNSLSYKVYMREAKKITPFYENIFEYISILY